VSHSSKVCEGPCGDPRHLFFLEQRGCGVTTFLCWISTLSRHYFSKTFPSVSCCKVFKRYNILKRELQPSWRKQHLRWQESKLSDMHTHMDGTRRAPIPLPSSLVPRGHARCEMGRWAETGRFAPKKEEMAWKALTITVAARGRDGV